MKRHASDFRRYNRKVHAYLEGRRLSAELDTTGPLVFTRLPGCGLEVSVSDAYDPVGPLALLHYGDDRTEPDQLEVEYDDIDGVEVYRVSTHEGELIFPARIVPVHPPSPAFEALRRRTLATR